MKKFKKLVPAFCMLLLSAVMLASGTYAWFSVNDRVFATGMQVEAKANTQFLVIGSAITTGDDAKYFTTANAVTAAFTKTAGGIVEDTKSTNKVYPVAYKNSTDWDAKVGQTTVGLNNINDNTWFTANSTSFGNVTGGSGNALEVKNAKNVTLGAADYFLTYTGYVGLAAGSTDFNGSLKITFDNTGLDDAIRYVIVVTPYTGTTAGTAGTPIIKSRTTGIEVSDISLAAATADDGTGAKSVEIKVYVCVNGYGENIKDGANPVSGEVKLSIVANPIAGN